MNPTYDYYYYVMYIKNFYKLFSTQAYGIQMSTTTAAANYSIYSVETQLDSRHTIA